MRKTSVYLPDRLKAALADLARRSGQSEAEVLRAALEHELASGRSSVPAPERARPGRLVGVGVGPGEPEMLTLAAVGALRRADRVVAPSTSTSAVGRAETVVRQAVPEVRIERLVFEMAPSRAARDEAVGRAAARVADCLEAGEEVAFITLGDPLVYSTFTSVRAEVIRLRPGSVVESVPGIMAFQVLAARTQTTLADERQRLIVRTALEGDDLAGDLARPDATVIAYKGGRRLDELAEGVRRAGRPGAVAGELLGLAGERIGALDDFADAPASYLSTVIVPAVEES